LTPSARSANLIAGDGTKNGLPAPNKELIANPKQPLDRKSPIQVTCEPLFNARQTGLDKQQAVQEKPALLACYREGINAHLMAAIAMAEERPGGLLMPNQSLLYTGRVLACSQLNTMMHVCRELCGGQICVTSDFAAFQDPETAPWLEKYYTINADWRSEDRRRLLAFARDLLNSDYAGHRLTFQLFARSPPFAHLAAVYRNFDRDVPLRFVHKSAGRGITFARIQHPASTRSRVTWSEHWTAKSGLRRLCPIADKGSTHDLETEGIEAPAHGGVPTLPDLRVGPG
jgi:4-hydroxyphenylacetate 3-hydroxylase C terminal